MANTVLLKRAATQGKVPLVADLALGEIACNYYDGKLYLRTFNGVTNAIVAVGFDRVARTGDTMSGALLVGEGAGSNVISLTGGATSGVGVTLAADGSSAGSNVSLTVASKGGGNLSLSTGGGEQLRVLHVANAVQYLTIRGAADTGSPTIGVSGTTAGAGIVFDRGRSATFAAPYLFNNAGGIATDTASSFWRGLQIASPAYTVSGVSVFPRFSLYGDYDTLTDPTSRSFVLSLGNSAGSVSRDHDLIIHNSTHGATTSTTGCIGFRTASSGSPGLLTVSDDSTSPVAGRLSVIGPQTGLGRIALRSSGALYFVSNGGNGIDFRTNGSSTSDGSTQFQITNTTGAVNYVRATGSATGNSVSLSAQGSDTNVSLSLAARGNAGVWLSSNSSLSLVAGNPTGAVNWTTTNGSTTGNAVTFGGNGTDANVSVAVRPKGTGSVDLQNGSAETQFTVTNTAGANMAVTATGGVTSSTRPSIGIPGGAGFNIYSTGNTIHFCTNGPGGNVQMQVEPVSSAVNCVVLRGASASTGVVQVAAAGTSTNVGIALIPKASGGLMAALPDSTATGGNARGGDSVDWQQVRDSASQVASGQYAILAGGRNNTASAQDSTVGGGYLNIATGAGATIGGGIANVADGQNSCIPGGFRAATRGTYGKLAYASERFATNGDAQIAWHVLRAETTAATATRLTSNAGTASTTNSVPLVNSSVYMIRGEVVARDTTTNDVATWQFNFVIKRGASAAATAVVGTAKKDRLAYDAAASTWDVNVAADTTNGGIAVTATGQTAKTIRWVSRIETIEVG